jgi:ATP-dependent exoDNAse (exonuclease V) alpha subunit
MSERQGIELARDFVRAEFVDRGMIADLNVHWDMTEDGMPKPHAHVMLTMRAIDKNGFGQKVRDWNRTEMVERWRERWAELANERLAELDIDARIDHRSLEAQGIALDPQSQIGAPAKRIEVHGIEGEGLEADRAHMHRDIARGNGERIIADPSLALGESNPVPALSGPVMVVALLPHRVPLAETVSNFSSAPLLSYCFWWRSRHDSNMRPTV